MQQIVDIKSDIIAVNNVEQHVDNYHQFIVNYSGLFQRLQSVKSLQWLPKKNIKLLQNRFTCLLLVGLYTSFTS